jgi:DNA-3-methyladenine glycosylase II
MVRTSSSIRSHVEELANREPAFARLVERHGIPEPRTSARGAQTLLRTIVGQQVSVAAARSMWAKLEAAFGAPPDLHLLLAATDEELRAAGMSRQKAGYIRSLAELDHDGEVTGGKDIGASFGEQQIDFRRPAADAFDLGQEGDRLLVVVRQIVEVQLAVMIELGRLMGLGEKPSEKQLRELAEAWRPYRGAAAVLAWHSYNSSVL